MSIESEIETLAAEIHEAWEYQYDECTHGHYSGGATHGEPYAMCEIFARRIIYRRADSFIKSNQYWLKHYGEMGAAPAFDPYGRSADV